MAKFNFPKCWGNTAGRNCSTRQGVPTVSINPSESPYHPLLEPLTRSRLTRLMAAIKKNLRPECEPPRNPRNIVAGWDLFFARPRTPSTHLEVSTTPMPPRLASLTSSEAQRDWMIYNNHFDQPQAYRSQSPGSWVTTLESSLIEPCPSERSRQVDDLGDVRADFYSTSTLTTFSTPERRTGHAHSSKDEVTSPARRPSSEIGASTGSIASFVNVYRDFWACDDRASQRTGVNGASDQPNASPVSPINPNSALGPTRLMSPISPISPISPDAAGAADLFFRLFWADESRKSQHQDANTDKHSIAHSAPSPTSPDPMGLFFRLFWANDRMVRVNSMPELSKSSSSIDTGSPTPTTSSIMTLTETGVANERFFESAAVPLASALRSSPMDPFLRPSDAPGGLDRLRDIALQPPLRPIVRSTVPPVRPPRPPAYLCPPPISPSPLDGAPPHVVAAVNDAVLRENIQRLWGSNPNF